LAPLGTAWRHHDRELAARYKLEDAIAVAAFAKTSLYMERNLLLPFDTAVANSTYFDLISCSFISPPKYLKFVELLSI